MNVWLETIKDLMPAVTAAFAFGAVVLGFINSRRIEKVRHLANSMKDQLVAVAHARGILEGRAEVAAEAVLEAALAAARKLQEAEKPKVDDPR